MARLPPKIDVQTYLQNKLSEGKELEWWTEFENLYNRKLWHQLTLKLLAYVSQPDKTYTQLLELYHNFIADFEMRMNPLYLLEIISFVVKGNPDVEWTITFLKGMKEKVCLIVSLNDQILTDLFYRSK